MKGSLKNPSGFILRPCFWHWGWFKFFNCELQNLILDIYDHRKKILLSSWRMLQPFPGLVLLYLYVITIEAYRIIRLGVRIKKCTLFVVARQVPQYYSVVASRTSILVFVWQKSRPCSCYFKCLNITTPLNNPEHAAFHSPRCIQRALYGPRLWSSSKEPPAGLLCRQYDQHSV